MAEHAHDSKPGKRLVIFGCGYVGSEVARRGLTLGWQVTALTRNAAKAERLRAEGVTVVEADLASDAWHGQIAGGADFVLNSVSSGGGGASGYRRSYLEGMDSVLIWTRKARVGTLVYTGSTSVYGQGDGARVDEESATEARNETAEILLETENRLRAQGGACERWIIFRLAGIYGPERHHLLDQLREGATELPGRGTHRLNLIHRDDIVSAVFAAFNAPADIANEVFNLSDGTPAAKSEVADWLAHKLAVPVPTFSGKATGGRREVVPDRVILNAKAQAMLGWRPEYPDFRAGYEKILSL